MVGSLRIQGTKAVIFVIYVGDGTDMINAAAWSGRPKS